MIPAAHADVPQTAAYTGPLVPLSGRFIGPPPQLGGSAAGVTHQIESGEPPVPDPDDFWVLGTSALGISTKLA